MTAQLMFNRTKRSAALPGGKHVRAAERERAMGDGAKHDATASGRSEERSGEALFRVPRRPLERSSGAARPARPGGFANKPADLCERSAKQGASAGGGRASER